VGALGIVDDDNVSLSNLQRQPVHDTSAVGSRKVQSARAAVDRLNPHVAVELFELRLATGNARELVGAYDIVVDCSDNFATRYAVSDACFHEKKTLVLGAVGQFDGSLTSLKPHLARADGEPNPTYRCLFPEPPPDGLLPTCAEAGILGALVGVIGSLQALEAIKEIVGVGRSLVGRLLLYDARDTRFETIEYRWDPSNPLNGTSAGR
jgi:adenylyltransferase/sulfurtransferase